MIATNRDERRPQETVRRRKKPLHGQSATGQYLPEFQSTVSGGNPLLSSRGAREYCGDISEMTLWRWTREHSFPRPDMTLNRRRFWRRSSLDTWLNAMLGKPA